MVSHISSAILSRYCNVDFVFASALRGTTVKKVTVSYDISCQWFRNLLHRVKQLPDHLSKHIMTLIIDAVVPKLHIRGHKVVCWAPFGLNYRPGVGRTDGEGIERRWSETNGAAANTKEMREGHRQDTLDDICNDSNYQKVKNLRA